MDQSQTYPDFFKVFIPEISSEKLLIPAAFIACIDKMLPVKIILRNRLGSIWQVTVVYTENDAFLFNGWENFVKDNSLAFGEFIVFRYNGDCIFHFRIYEKCGCEKKDARASQSIGKRLFNVKEEEERKEQYCKDYDNGHKEDKEPKPGPNMKMVGGKAKPCGRGRKKKGLLDLEGCKVHSAIKTEPNEGEQPTQATERAINAPRMNMPARPFFVAILRVYQVHNNFMQVPADFARSCELRVTQFIRLRVSDGKEWCVRCICNSGKARLSMGWAAFMSGNDLKVGDKCVFELIQATDIVLKVTIFRC